MVDVVADCTMTGSVTCTAGAFGFEEVGVRWPLRFPLADGRETNDSLLDLKDLRAGCEMGDLLVHPPCRHHS